MKIALVSIIYKPVTTSSKGGTETWTANFALESARRGNEIDLYAVGGSLDAHNINLIPLLPKAVPEYYSDPYLAVDSPVEFIKRRERFVAEAYARALSRVVEEADTYDLIIDSTAGASIASAYALGIPIFTIVHMPVSFHTDYYARTFGWPKNNTAILPSRYQYEHAGAVPTNNKVVIPHGLNTRTCSYDPRGGTRMLWMSRIHHSQMDKGAMEAVCAAEATGKDLLLTGIVEHSSKEYFEKEIRPHVKGNIAFEEQRVDTEVDKNALYGQSKVFLLPIKWEEPFGYVFLESMACGTPVIAYARGAVPEIVKDGVTGFIVNSSDEDIRGDFIVKKTGMAGLCEAIARIYALPPEEYTRMREACRRHVEGHYTVERMVDAYEDLHKKLTAIA